MKDKFLTVKIERIVPDGFGIGFAENLTVFVSLVAPGDFVKVKIERQKGKVAFASLVEILTPSESRVVPPCPYFGPCGGCDFQQLNYAAQLEAKAGIVRDSLRRIGKIDWQDEIKITASPKEWRYRTRAQWKRDNNKIGYYERNSHRVCDVKVCPILIEQLQQTLEEVRKLPNADFLEVQATAAADSVSIRFDKTSDNPYFDENFYAANKTEAESSRSEVAAKHEKSREINLKINKYNYLFSADTFFQINHSALPPFVEAVIDKDLSGEFALDLYCGVGLFTLPLAEKFENVIGIEGNETSIEFARKNAAINNLENVEFATSGVGKWFEENKNSLPAIDFVLLDPPRSGAERETIENLIALKPKQIIYVSCNPATLARDLRMLIEGNFILDKIEAFDFFPQTHHVETIAHLKLNKTLSN